MCVQEQYKTVSLISLVNFGELCLKFVKMLVKFDYSLANQSAKIVINCTEVYKIVSVTAGVALGVGGLAIGVLA